MTAGMLTKDRKQWKVCTCFRMHWTEKIH